VPVCTLSVSPVAPPKNNKGKGKDGEKDDEVSWQVLDPHHVRFAGKIDDDKAPRFTITIGCTDRSGNASSATTTVTLATKDHDGGHDRDR
jgi:hypothetical protein